MNETQLRNQALDYLKYKGYYCWLTNTQGNYNPRTNSYYKNPRLLSGVADILGIMPETGIFFSIELKVKNRRQTPAQKLFEQNIKDRNGIYLLAYDLDDIIKYFK